LLRHAASILSLAADLVKSEPAYLTRVVEDPSSTDHLRPCGRKGGVRMPARVKALLVALAIVAIAAANGSNPWGP
jgi:hypothetical protein